MSTTPSGATPPSPPAKSVEEANRELRARVAAASPAPPEPKREGLRDTVESIVFALILAFLFRTFEAEAFVIPTGSMAPTLYGRHKETTCTKCGSHIVVGASDEFNAEIGSLYQDTRLVGALCPNCRYENTQLKDALAFNGDRILVNKFPYEIGEPNRWDVFVFKYPQEPDINYIKRLVGLPGETIRIRQGDLYLWDGKKEQILRKPNPAKQRALQMTVYDDRHAPTELIKAGWPERWASVKKDANGDWTPTDTWMHHQEQRVFRLDGDDLKEPAWLRYRHYNSRPEDWEAFENNQPVQPRLELIADFCPYNAVWGQGDPRAIDTRNVGGVDQGAFWVGDLTLSGTIDLSSIKTGGELILELCEGVHIYRCRIDLTNGAAKLFEINQGLNNEERQVAEAATPLSTEGKYGISFANVDNRVCLWVNDTLVDFGDAAKFDRDAGTGVSLPQRTDLEPAGIALRGASGIVRDLVIQRDVYYRAGDVQTDSLAHDLEELVADVDAYRQKYNSRAQYDENEFKVDDDGFLAFGDNSPRSKDSRLWGEPHSVARRLLVGRAFYIYWPHGVPFLNNGRGYSILDHKEAKVRDNHIEYTPVRDYPKYTVPFYPQVDRMKRIR
ncbi:MAG TPA: signal peptidase I [Caulifigura sp.]|jgi:signal peptidase I|nr:signal peptidase I [Caulifigura sp.]